MTKRTPCWTGWAYEGHRGGSRGGTLSTAGLKRATDGGSSARTNLATLTVIKVAAGPPFVIPGQAR